MFRKKVPTTGLVLLRTGRVHTEPIPPDAKSFRVADKETYVTDAPGRFWNETPIPRGWILVYPQSNPQPFSIQEGQPDATGIKPILVAEPKGFWAEDLDNLVGGWIFRLAHAALQAPKQGMDWKLLALGIGAAVAGLGVLWWYFYGGAR